MTAGLNIKVKIHRYTFVDDDSVGGAQPTGTVIYDGIEARKFTRTPDMMFFEQGLETLRASQFLLVPATLAIKEHDELEIVFPPNHLDYGKHFRIQGLPDVGFHPGDKRGYLIVSTTRSEVAHKHQ